MTFSSLFIFRCGTVLLLGVGVRQVGVHRWKVTITEGDDDGFSEHFLIEGLQSTVYIQVVVVISRNSL